MPNNGLVSLRRLAKIKLTSEFRIPLKSGQMTPEVALEGPRKFIISVAATR